MDGQGPLIIFLLFFVRLLVPLLVLLALGYLYEHWSARRAPTYRSDYGQNPSARSNWPSAGTLNQTPCWETMKCSPEQRALCPAAERRGVPCWLTMQLVEGHLPDRCLDCQVFKEGASLPLASD